MIDEDVAKRFLDRLFEKIRIRTKDWSEEEKAKLRKELGLQCPNED